jgi:hypothetical protein
MFLPVFGNQLSKRLRALLLISPPILVGLAHQPGNWMGIFCWLWFLNVMVIRGWCLTTWLDDLCSIVGSYAPEFHSDALAVSSGDRSHQRRSMYLTE